MEVLYLIVRARLADEILLGVPTAAGPGGRLGRASGPHLSVGPKTNSTDLVATNNVSILDWAAQSDSVRGCRSARIDIDFSSSSGC